MHYIKKFWCLITENVWLQHGYKDAIAEFCNIWNELRATDHIKISYTDVVAICDQVNYGNEIGKHSEKAVEVEH